MATGTPHSSAFASTQQTQPTQSTNPYSQPPIQKQELDLSPSSLDILPLLTSILTRFQAGTTTTNTHNTSTGGTPSQAPASTPSSSALHAFDKNIFSTKPLNSKELPLAADELKQRMRKSREAILSTCPDLDVGLEEQEAEIKELDERIARQKAALEELKELGRKVRLRGGGLSSTKSGSHGLRDGGDDSMDVS